MGLKMMYLDSKTFLNKFSLVVQRPELRTFKCERSLELSDKWKYMDYVDVLSDVIAEIIVCKT